MDKWVKITEKQVPENLEWELVSGGQIVQRSLARGQWKGRTYRYEHRLDTSDGTVAYYRMYVR